MKELLERERASAAIEELRVRRSGLLLIETGVGIGKTLLVPAAYWQAEELAYDVFDCPWV